MIAEFRIALDNLAEGLGVHLPDLSDDEYLAVGEIMVREHGTTMSATFVDLNRIVNRVVDRRVRACCEGKVYAGPSGLRKRHTCQGRKGQPFVDEFKTMGAVARVFEISKKRRTHAHPACIAAYREGLIASVHWNCLPILCTDEGCDHDACGYWRDHMDDDDDQRGRGA